MPAPMSDHEAHLWAEETREMTTGTLIPGSTVTIAGIDYIVETAKPYTYNGKARTEYNLRRPRGKRFYYVVQYENSSLSEVV